MNRNEKLLLEKLLECGEYLEKSAEEIIKLRGQLAQAQKLEEYDAGYLPDNPDQDFCRYILACAFDFYKDQLNNTTKYKG
jgi:hypothetical protein